MKFCTNCGAQLNEDSKFCTSCGTPVKTEEPKAEAPKPAEPVQYTAPAQPVEPVQYTAPAKPAGTAPAAPKKKMNLKVPIILGSIGLVLIIGIIVFFTVFFPELVAKHVKMSDFVKAKFNSESFVDGNISGYITLDLDKAYNTVVENKDAVPQYEFNSYFKYFSKEFEDKLASDVIKEPFKYISDSRNIANLEGKLGVRFDQEQTVEVKLADEIKAQSIDVMKPVEVDFYKYLDENYYNTGISPAKVYVNMKSGEYKVDDYTLELEGFKGSDWDTSGQFTIKKDGKEVTTVYVYSDSSYVEDGGKSTITLSYSSDYNDDTFIYNTPIKVKSKSKDYDVKAQSGITAAEAKKNIDTLIKKTEKDHKSTGYDVKVVSSYLLTAKDKEEEDVNYIINIYYSKYKKGNYTYYYQDAFKNCYIDTYEEKEDDQFKYEDASASWSSFSKESEALAELKSDYGKDYKIQLIK